MRTASAWPTGPRACSISSRATGRRPAHGSSTGSRRSGRRDAVLTLPWAIACVRLGPGAARRGERGAEPAPRRRATRRGPRGARTSSARTARATTRWVAPVSCSAGSTRPGAWATARSNPLRVSRRTRPMRCTCSATSRPIPTGSMPRAARPTTARHWRSPSRAGMRPLVAHCHLGLGQAPSAPGPPRAGPRAPHHGHDDVPRHGHVVLAGAGRGRAGEADRVQPPCSVATGVFSPRSSLTGGRRD